MNISFLSTSFLWALPLALAPLILHLFYRRKRSVIYFSYIELIRRAAERTRIKSRIRKYLLLAVRTLLMLLLVLYFARPVWQLGKTSKDTDRTINAVILIDASYSMGYIENGKSRFESAVEKARRIINMLPPEARTGIVAYSDRVEYASPSLTNDPSRLARELDKLKLTSRPTNAAPAAAAAQALAQDAPNAELNLIILSDLAGHAFRELPAKSVSRLKVISITPPASENIFLSGLKGEYDDSMYQWRIEASAEYTTGLGKASWPVNFMSGSRKIGSDFASLNPSGRTTCVFSYSSEDTNISASARLFEDNLNADNIRYVVLRRGDPYKVWLVDGDPKSGGITSEVFYLRNIFPAADIMTEQEFEKRSFTPPGVVVAANIIRVPPAVEQFVLSGGGLLLFPGDRTPDDFASDILPVTFGAPFDQRQGVSWTAPQSHYLSGALDMKAFEWDKIYCEKGYILQPREGASVLASLSGGWPFIAEKQSGGGKCAVFATSGDRDWNNLPGRPLYAPLARNLVRYLSNTTFLKDISDITCGDAFSYRQTADPQIITPSGAAERPRSFPEEIVFENTSEPGFYKLMSSGREVFRFAVNLNTSSGESRLDAASQGRIKEYFSGAPLVLLDPEEWEKQLSTVLTGIDASRHFLLAILILLLLEVALTSQLKKKTL